MKLTKYRIRVNLTEDDLDKMGFKYAFSYYAGGGHNCYFENGDVYFVSYDNKIIEKYLTNQEIRKMKLDKIYETNL